MAYAYTTARLDSPADSPVIVIGGRVCSRSAYRSSEFPDFGDTPDWWTAVVTFGFLTAIAGLLIGINAGAALAVVGVVLFLATAAAVGAGQFELSTSTAGLGFVWTTAGIAVSAGSLPPSLAIALGFLIGGFTIFAFGIYRRNLSAHREATSA